MAASHSSPNAYYIRKAATKKKRSNKTKSRKKEKYVSPAVTERDVDAKNRRFIMDMKPSWADNFEVGTVDFIAKEVKMFLVKFFGSMGNKNVQFPGQIEIQLRLEYNKNLDCPFLSSRLVVKSKYGNVHSGGVLIFALSGNVQDIFQVLLSMEITCFQLEVVDEKYHDEVKDFLSNNHFLRKLCISERYLKGDQDLVRDVMRSSASLSALELLQRFGSKKTRIIDSLKQHLAHTDEGQCLKKLDLKQVKSLTPTILDVLAEGLTKSPKLKTLDMSVVRYSPLRIDISKLAKVLRNHENLEEWEVGRRIVVNFESILQCAKLVKHSKSLKKLDLQALWGLDRCLIHPDTWIYLGRALAKAQSLQYLDISNHQISKESWKAFGEGLKANTSLLALKAARPRFYEEKETDVLLPVLEALRENKTLQSLELSNFDFSKGFVSLKVLESILIESKSLKSLVLKDSGMTDEGAAILSRRLPLMKGSIESFNLNGHECTVKGARAFVEGMKNNHSILSVGFGGKYRGGSMPGYVRPAVGAVGFEKEFHEIEYYARMNRKGRRCMGSKTPINPSLWPLVFTKAMTIEEPLGHFLSGDVRKRDWFAGDHDTSIDAIFYLLRDVVALSGWAN